MAGAAGVVKEGVATVGGDVLSGRVVKTGPAPPRFPRSRGPNGPPASGGP
ncbi:hypothetical protein STTU_4725 [Streptomyces sp. Tu6071]|nr:hypothetical protein STTU_4725 [Streptomyces sp. Tu6071]